MKIHLVKKILFIQIALSTAFISCTQSNSQSALRDAAKLDSIDRAYILRDSIVLDSIKRETFSRHEKRGGKIEYSNQYNQGHRHIGLTAN